MPQFYELKTNKERFVYSFLFISLFCSMILAGSMLTFGFYMMLGYNALVFYAIIVLMTPVSIIGWLGFIILMIRKKKTGKSFFLRDEKDK